MGKLRKLHQHIYKITGAEEITAEQYKTLSTGARKRYRKKATSEGWPKVWEQLYTENDLRSQQLNR